MEIRIFLWDGWRKSKILYDATFDLFNILSSFCWGLHEDQPMLLCKLLAFLCAYGPSMSKIALVANQHNCHICICMLSSIFQPASQVIECLPPVGKHRSASFHCLIQNKEHKILIQYNHINMDAPNWHTYFVA